MPPRPSAELYDAHEARLRDLEDAFRNVNTTLLPVLGRMEAKLEHVGDRVDDLKRDVDVIRGDLGEARLAIAEAGTRDATRDAAVAALAEAEADRKEFRKGVRKWVLTAVGGVAVAALMAFLGLK